MTVKITALCVAVAMICSTLRIQRPELATAVSLVGSFAVIMLLLPQANGLTGWIDALQTFMRADRDIVTVVLKGAGITILAEMGAQLCADAGERAMAGRITLASRVAMIGLCAPLIGELAERIGGVLR